jgi:hypothetical protein
VRHLGESDRNEKTHLSFFCGMVLHILIEIVKISKQIFFPIFIFFGICLFFSFPALSQLLVRAEFYVQMNFWHLELWAALKTFFNLSESPIL